ncbi:MAG: isoamylase early set domain-containing protein [Treponema sp.]|nr:isoamylase early set domain-containing protein [Treponema sp.]
MSLKKSFSADGKTCNVVFNVNPTAASGAQNVYLVGEFNDWDKTATPMKKAADGSFSVKKQLDVNRQYQFRYCLDGVAWINDWKADAYIRSELANDDNSVVDTTVPATTKKSTAKKTASKK